MEASFTSGKITLVILKDNEIVETSIEPEKYVSQLSEQMKRLEAGIRKKMQDYQSAYSSGEKSVYRELPFY